MNFSLNLSGGGPPVVQQYTAEDILRDVASQIDEKLVIASVLVFTGYLFAYAILPAVLVGLRTIQEGEGGVIGAVLKDSWVLRMMIKFVELLRSFGETAMLGGAVLIFVFSWKQGSVGGLLVWIFWGFFGLAFLMFLSHAIGRIRELWGIL